MVSSRIKLQKTMTTQNTNFLPKAASASKEEQITAAIKEQGPLRPLAHLISIARAEIMGEVPESSATEPSAKSLVAIAQSLQEIQEHNDKIVAQVPQLEELNANYVNNGKLDEKETELATKLFSGIFASSLSSIESWAQIKRLDPALAAQLESSTVNQNESRAVGTQDLYENPAKLKGAISIIGEMIAEIPAAKARPTTAKPAFSQEELKTQTPETQVKGAKATPAQENSTNLTH